MSGIEPSGQSDPAKLRISDAERHQVAEVLREAAGDGRINLEELDQRLEAAFAAKTYAELVPLTEDLPASGSATTPVPAPGAVPAKPVRHIAIFSGFDRRGNWQVPAQLNVVAVMGGASIDLREATFTTPEVVITVNAVMGGAEIKVNDRTNVIMEGVGIMGGYGGPSGRVPARLSADSPTVRVRGFAFWGGVRVIRR